MESDLLMTLTSIRQLIRNALFAEVQGCIYIDFDITGRHPANFFANRPIRSDDGYQHDYPMARQQIRNEGDPTDIFYTVFGGEAQTLAQLIPDHVTIKQFHSVARQAQTIKNRFGNRALSCPAETGEPDDLARTHRGLYQSVL